MSENNSAEVLREIGKNSFFNSNGDAQKEERVFEL